MVLYIHVSSVKRQLQYLEAKLVENVNQIWNVGQSGYQTLGSRRSLGRRHGYQVMACQDPDDRGCNLSTAASDTERKRVLIRFPPSSQSPQPNAAFRVPIKKQKRRIII